jgi:hypothetical protein
LGRKTFIILYIIDNYETELLIGRRGREDIYLSFISPPFGGSTRRGWGEMAVVVE